MLDERGMERREFRRITRSRLRCGRITLDGFSGQVGVLDILDTSETWYVSCEKLGRAVIARPGYRWLELTPDEGEWWLTVMYDENGGLIQYYFDIVEKTFVGEDGEIRFTDLYLDLVMDGTGAWQILDRNELEEACRAGQISETLRDTAVARMERLSAQVIGNEPYWREFCRKAVTAVEKLHNPRMTEYSKNGASK